MEWTELINVYLGEKYCGICLKTNADSVLLPNNCEEFFSCMQIYNIPRYVCIWCRKRLETFSNLQAKAELAQRILSVVKSLADNPFFKFDKKIQSEIAKLKTEPYDIKHVYTTECNEVERDHETVSTKSTKKIGRARKSKITVTQDVKNKNPISDSDSNNIPFKEITNETYEDTASETFHLSDPHNVKLKASDKTEVPYEKQFKAKKDKNVQHEGKYDEILNAEDSLLETNEHLNQPDVILAIEELDNENLIISEEVVKYVKTRTLEESDKYKQSKLTKPSYINAKFRCEQCIIGYGSKHLYDDHMKHHSPSAGAHGCHSCRMYFGKHRELERHLYGHFRRHACRLCAHASVDMRAAAKHYVSQHSRVRFTCWLCNDDFRRAINLKKHLKKVHPAEAGSAGCPVCAAEFTGEDQLNEHVRTHTVSEIILHECTVCGKKSRNAYHMKQHERTHAKQTLPIVCAVCSKTFKNRQMLATHVQRLHTDNSKKYQCDCCGKFFFSKAELRSHVLWTHKREGGVQCATCYKKFRTAYLLNDHEQRIHRNVPKLKDKLCDLCGRGFSSWQLLKSHRYIHTGERPHACPDCGQAFRQKCALKIHRKAKHLRHGASRSNTLSALPRASEIDEQTS